jgi:hypothetical protein
MLGLKKPFARKIAVLPSTESNLFGDVQALRIIPRLRFISVDNQFLALLPNGWLFRIW